MKNGKVARRAGRARSPRPGADTTAKDRSHRGFSHEVREWSQEQLLHELQVHQAELEMQNEELRRTRLALEESRDWYLDLYEFAPIGYFTITPEGVIAGVNHAGAAILGVPRLMMMDRRFAGFVAAGDAELWSHHMVSVLQGQDAMTCELTLARPDGSIRTVRLDSVRMGQRTGSVVVRTAVSDITDHKAAEQELRVAAIAFETQEGIVITDHAARIQRVNRALTELIGYNAEELVGQTFPFIAAARPNDAFYKRMWAILRQEKYWQGEVAYQRKKGGMVPVWLTVSAVTTPNGRVTNYVGTMADNTPHKEAEAKIHRLAFYDPLTQLPNRRLLLERLGQALVTSARTGRHGTILFIDLDNFKSINDTKGHDAGDQLLVETATRLLSCTRECDTVSRLGGDEFVVLLEELNQTESLAALEAEGVAEKIRRMFVQPFRIGGHEHRGTPSIGISLFIGPADTVEDVLKRADIAMYRAKTSGRNAIRFFDPAMQVAVESRAALEADLHGALAGSQFDLHYQMQVDRRHEITGAEVLLRWHHPSGKLVMPGQFIAVAEDNGLIVPIGQWVLETTCAQLKAWDESASGKDLHLSMNVSARQFREKDFVEKVRDALERSGADPTHLEFECTESLMLDDIADTIERMRALKALGIGISMDDFGTGFSSLRFLKRLPLDHLKIDQSFVRDLASDPGDVMIVETIIGMARTLGLGVIAEGVETKGELDFLEKHGCPAFQGYLFSPPVRLAEFERQARTPGTTLLARS